MRLALLAMMVGCTESPSSGEELVGEVVGEEVPTIRLADADGTVHDLTERDGITVVDFSAMWCLRCNDIAPELQELYEERQSDGVEVWGILFQDNDGDDPTPADLRAWSAEHGLTHPVLADPGEETFDAWGGGHQPIVYVVSAQGKVVYHGDGPGQNPAIHEAIDGLL